MHGLPHTTVKKRSDSLALTFLFYLFVSFLWNLGTFTIEIPRFFPLLLLLQVARNPSDGACIFHTSPWSQPFPE